jgi:hypothetical protein
MDVAHEYRRLPTDLLAPHRQLRSFGVVNRTRFLPSRSIRVRFTVFTLPFRGRPAPRTFELSYFAAASRRNHARIVSGRTIWQHVARSRAVRALPIKASRRRCASVNLMRSLPVAVVNASFSVRTSSCTYSSCRAMRSLIAAAIVAIRNWIGNGSIGCSAQSLRSAPSSKLPKRAWPWDTVSDDFPDTTARAVLAVCRGARLDATARSRPWPSRWQAWQIAAFCRRPRGCTCSPIRSCT